MTKPRRALSSARGEPVRACPGLRRGLRHFSTRGEKWARVDSDSSSSGRRVAARPRSRTRCRAREPDHPVSFAFIQDAELLATWRAQAAAPSRISVIPNVGRFLTWWHARSKLAQIAMAAGTILLFFILIGAISSAGDDGKKNAASSPPPAAEQPPPPAADPPPPPTTPTAATTTTAASSAAAAQRDRGPGERPPRRRAVPRIAGVFTLRPA